MQKLKRAFFLTTATLMLVACSSDDTTSERADTDANPGQIIQQAEEWTSHSPNATLSWLPIQLDGDHGQAAKLVAQDSPLLSDTDLPTLTYDIDFAQTGTYALNVHGRHDSNYVNLAEQHTIITYGSDDGNIELPVNGFDDQWQWISTDVFGQPLTIEVKTAGIHLFKIASATTGLLLDKISIDKVGNSGNEINNDLAIEQPVGNLTSNPQSNTGSIEVADDPVSNSVADVNNAPSVTISGPAQTASGQVVTLQAIATDDGEPQGAIYYYWTKTTGPGDVLISNLQSATTEVIFTTPGNYSLQVSANDGQSYNNAKITITVTDQSATPVTSLAPVPQGNQAPVITPIETITTQAGKTITITANATDDGLPHAGLYYYWSKLAGPGSAVFSPTNAATTQTRFNATGTYKLQLNVSDGELYNNHEFTVHVTAGETANETIEPVETIHSNNINGNWKSINTIGKVTARHEAGGVVVNGKLYVMGGRGKRPVDVYDPTTKQWKTVANAPMEMHHFQPVAIGHKIYVVGAFTCCYPIEKIVDRIYVFDTRTNKWSKGSKIPANRQRGGAGAAVHNGKIYLLGGNTNGHSGGAVGWFDEFDPNTGEWKTLANAPDARDHATIAIANGKLVAAAGRKSDHPQTFLNTVSRTNVYDFRTGKWAREANIPTARAGTMTVAHGSEILIIGGESMASAFAHNNVEAYNVDSKKWRKLSSLKTGRHGGAAAFLNGVLHVVTGSDRRGSRGESTAHDTLR